MIKFTELIRLEPMTSHPAADSITEKILSSSKYGNLSPSLVRRVVSEALPRGRNPAESEQAARTLLHQITGAYQRPRPRYDEWVQQMETASRESEESFRTLCRLLMARHSSTGERSAILTDLYGWLFENIPPIRSILDLGCGLNPISLPFMNIAPDTRYVACDIHTDLADFLNWFFQHTGTNGMALAADIVFELPEEECDLALLLKLLPVIEQQKRGASKELLSRIHARYLLITFPTRTLSGRNVGMSANYEKAYHTTLQDLGTLIERREFPGELCFLIEKWKV